MTGTVSYWQRSFDAPRNADAAAGAGPRAGVVERDVIVIGGGVCGISLALELERRGCTALVLERGRIASGASGKNAGFLMRGAADNYAVAIETHGRQRAQLLWRWSEENLALLREDGAAALTTYRDAPSCLVALDEAEESELRRSHDLLIEDGFDSAIAHSGGDSLWRSGLPRIGLVNPGDASCNPCELVAHLASKLKDPPVEECRVTSLRREGGGVTVRTDRGDYHAGRIALCTNAFAAQLAPELGQIIQPNRGQMLAIDGAGLTLDASYYVNRGHEYVRRTPEGAIVVGGMRGRFPDTERCGDDCTTEALQAALIEFTAQILGGDPHSLRVTDRWAGVMAFTPDGLPLIGPLIGRLIGPLDARVWFCGGFNGHGMSLARRCARACAEEMLGGEPSPFPLSRFIAERIKDAD